MTPLEREWRALRTPLVLASAAAWVAILLVPESVMVHTPVHRHSFVASLERLDVPGVSLGWLIMMVAMMAPLLAAPIRHVRTRSFAKQRDRATALFVVGYLATWTAAGATLIASTLALRVVSAGSLLPLVGFVAATILWQMSPAKQVCLNRLQAHAALPAFGLRADAGALAFGLRHGFWCAAACWAPMSLPLLFTSGHLVFMVIATSWIWAEQASPSVEPRWTFRAPVLSYSKWWSRRS